jgi:uncharacterized membrane protein YjfL (UPF0719 family)
MENLAAFVGFSLWIPIGMRLTMSKDTDSKPSIPKQLIWAVLIASVIAISAIVVLSSLMPRANPPVMGTLIDLQALARAVEGFESEY